MDSNKQQKIDFSHVGTLRSPKSKCLRDLISDEGTFPDSECLVVLSHGGRSSLGALKDFFFHFMCMCVFMWSMCAGACRSQKRVSDILDL